MVVKIPVFVTRWVGEVFALSPVGIYPRSPLEKNPYTVLPVVRTVLNVEVFGILDGYNQNSKSPFIETTSVSILIPISSDDNELSPNLANLVGGEDIETDGGVS